MVPPPKAPLASWITGWFNLLGQVAVTTGIRSAYIFPTHCVRMLYLQYLFYSFACANFLSTAIAISTDYEPSPARTIGIYAAVLVTQGLINTFGVHLLKYINNVSVWWHALGTTSLVIAILAKVSVHVFISVLMYVDILD